MKKKKINLKQATLSVFLLLLLASPVGMQAQQGFVHEASTEYQWPEEKEVLANLDKWQDMKFGVLFHWGCGRFHCFRYL